MSESVSPELIELQQAVVGRFSIVRELGRGGMGIVFLARDVALDRPVAVKLLPPEFAISAGHRERFLREARTAARLTHPHIVPIHSVEEHGRLVFFVMRYVDGETLASLVLRHGVLNNREAMRITREVAWALAHAHANGVVHRDVKPENVLIERDSGRALVTDFGIAQSIDGTNTSGQRRVAGTPRYMSPEQAAGEALDGRSDVYSLGAVSYFMVAGRSPFDAPSAAALLVKHLNDPVPVVRVVNPRVPLAFASAIEKCLAKNPAERYATADDLARTLESASEGAPAPVLEFVREMDVAGSEIGMALAGLVSSSLMAAFGARQVGSPDLGGSISLIVASVLFLGAAAAMGGLLVLRLASVAQRIRALVASGYGHSAVRAGLESSARDSAQARRRHPLLAPAAAAGMLGGVLLTRTGPSWLPLVGAAAAVVIPTAAIRQLWLQRRVWTRALAGRFGRFVFRVASAGLRRGDAKAAAGEPTVVAIGEAAAELYRALPASLQAEYPQLPNVLHRLQAEAMATRLAAEPGGNARFEAAVSALESLRIDLLRLHAGAARREDLTASIDAAQRLGSHIDARLEADREVRRAISD
jgi:serine/threonine-protein kinase